jgi:Double zinc ribbon
MLACPVCDADNPVRARFCNACGTRLTPPEALVRNQVLALIRICSWLLFVEGLLADATGGLGEVDRSLPGVAAAAGGGQGPERLLGSAPGLVLLASYAAVAALAGALVTSRRDVGEAT